MAQAASIPRLVHWSGESLMNTSLGQNTATSDSTCESWVFAVANQQILGRDTWPNRLRAAGSADSQGASFAATVAPHRLITTTAEESGAACGGPRGSVTNVRVQGRPTLAQTVLGFLDSLVACQRRRHRTIRRRS